MGTLGTLMETTKKKVADPTKTANELRTSVALMADKAVIDMRTSLTGAMVTADEKARVLVESSIQSTTEKAVAVADSAAKHTKPVVDTITYPVAETERKLVATVASARAMYVARQLQGKIVVGMTVVNVRVGVETEIGPEDHEDGALKALHQDVHDASASGEEDGTKKNSKFSKLARNAMESLLVQMEKRAMAWQTTSFAHDVLLINALTIGIPGFNNAASVEIEFSVTAGSLIASHQQRLNSTSNSSSHSSVAAEPEMKSCGETGVGSSQAETVH